MIKTKKTIYNRIITRKTITINIIMSYLSCVNISIYCKSKTCTDNLHKIAKCLIVTKLLFLREAVPELYIVYLQYANYNNMPILPGVPE